ncbi:MAG: feruloyl-CoA synthase [Myxococcota bacterium]
MSDRAVPRLAPAETALEPRSDGSFVLRSPRALHEPDPTVGTWLARWAKDKPDQIAFAERASPDHDAPWRTSTWRQIHADARAIGQALLDRRLSLERPVVVLSGNSLNHLRVMLGALLAGVPVVPVSQAYSLRSRDYLQLRSIVDRVTPGLVFAEPGPSFEPALRAIDRPEIVTSVPCEAIETTPLSALLRTMPDSIDQAPVGPDTVAKILMTSGSTGRPKGVLNTHRMLTANQAAVAQVWPFLEEAPPVIVDWLPWSHTFGGNHNVNMVLRNGGTLYIDDGGPAPGKLELTLRNLRDVAPTLSFNVPAGYAMLVQALEDDASLCERFFSRLQAIFYAAAALPQATWERLDRVAERTLGHRVWLTTAWGATETAPLVTSAHFPSEDAGNIGVPVPGVELKLVPSGDRFEMRVRGPNVTPGYHRQPEVSANAFDDEGFYLIGDAGRLVDEADPSRGVRFEGRVSEDFKLASGTWVRAGPLRTKALSDAGGILSAGVVAGHDTDQVVLLAWLAPGPARGLAPNTTEMRELVRHPAIHVALRQRMRTSQTTASSRRIARVLLLEQEPDLDGGEITDKGYINAGAVLRNRPREVARCIAGDGDDIVDLG